MRRRVRVTPEAEAELVGAARWYEERRKGLGAEFLRGVAATVARIRRNPYLYARVEGEARRGLVRRFPYSVIYELDGDDVVVLAYFHEHRDPDEWRKRL